MELKLEQEDRDKLIALGVCPKCLAEFTHDINEPFAHCNCGSSEWTGELPMIAELRFHQRNLVEFVSSLLGCTELNLDEVEHETGLVVAKAGAYLADNFDC